MQRPERVTACRALLPLPTPCPAFSASPVHSLGTHGSKFLLLIGNLSANFEGAWCAAPCFAVRTVAARVGRLPTREFWPASSCLSTSVFERSARDAGMSEYLESCSGAQEAGSTACSSLLHPLGFGTLSKDGAMPHVQAHRQTRPYRRQRSSADGQAHTLSSLCWQCRMAVSAGASAASAELPLVLLALDAMCQMRSMHAVQHPHSHTYTSCAAPSRWRVQAVSSARGIWQCMAVYS